MPAFFEALEARCRQQDTLLCVGLDPHPEFLPAPTARAARDFSLRLIEQTAPWAAACKPNAAFFERFGAEGWQALAEVIAAARSAGLPVILDAKRGDIASTAAAYAEAIFARLQADAVTLNPYLGYDAVEPFVSWQERAVFLLCKTSNPGSADLQDLPLQDGRPLYLHVAQRAQEWGRAGNVGLVVGATHPQALAQVRATAPGLWFLAPGVGAQGGDLQAALRAGLREDGLGVLVTVSRGIARQPDAAAAARTLREAIARARKR